MCVLAPELQEDQLGLLLRSASGPQEFRLLFRGPRLGTKRGGAPVFTRGLNAEGLAPGAVLQCRPSGNCGCSLFCFLFPHSRRARRTVSLAQGSGGCSEARGPAELMTFAGERDAAALRSGGEILTVTGLHTGLGCRSDQMVRLQ